ncbi:dihydroxyacetone kinase subunit L [Betaproteobacteria bacterium]|nr:dihydroxyacetone kinase subunit L [Betaproteobacteria bacterium]
MLRTSDLSTAIARMHAGIVPVREALNAADRVLGDGDTGMTVAQIVAAWQQAAPELPADLGSALSMLGKAARQASGSSLASVVSIGLSAAGRALAGRDTVQLAPVELADLMTKAAQAISERSGAAPGDKSLLDSLLVIRDAFQDADASGRGDLQRVALDAAQAALEAFRDKPSQLGRARVYGEQSAGHDDPGMLAVCLSLQAASAQDE